MLGTAHGRGRETMASGRNLPLNTHKAKGFQQRESLLRLPPHVMSCGQGCGTQHHPPQGLLCQWDAHRATAPPPPCTHSILHPRENPSHGLGEGGGSCCSSAALFCFVLSVQLPETWSHKTQFTIPAAFWHPTVLAYR